MSSIIFPISIILTIFHYQSISATESWSGVVENVFQLIKNIDTSLLNDGKNSLNASQMIAHEGFPVEEHTVTTADGYVLRLIRIPGDPTNKPVLLFAHGLFNSADDWLGRGPGSLPLVFAKLGYDVWLGNYRGNKYSRNNTAIKPENKLFWQFSWHELGIYDNPCMIDYILQKTGVLKVTYIGHSQGTTAAYVMLSERPEYNKKLNLLCCLSSVSWMTHAGSAVFRVLTLLRAALQLLVEALGWYEALPFSPPLSTLTQICGSSPISSIVCMTFVLFPFYGYDYKQIYLEHAGSQIAHVPAGSSWYQVFHYTQNAGSRTFNKFDYGVAKNLIKYGTVTPPAYPVNLITAKMAIFYSNNDLLSNLTDVRTLISKLPSEPDLFEVSCDEFNHMDYLWAKDAHLLVYENVKQLVDKYK